MVFPHLMMQTNNNNNNNNNYSNINYETAPHPFLLSFLCLPDCCAILPTSF